MIGQIFPDIYAFRHGISTDKKNIFCDLSRAQIIFWGHECQNISDILCENFQTVMNLNSVVEQSECFQGRAFWWKAYKPYVSV